MRFYGKWAGNPDGFAEDVSRCVVEVCDVIGNFYQCLNRRGKGDGGLFCGIHARKLVHGRELNVPRDQRQPISKTQERT